MGRSRAAGARPLGMADEELEALRKQRIAELQAKHGVSAPPPPAKPGLIGRRPRRAARARLIRARAGSCPAGPGPTWAGASLAACAPNCILEPKGVLSEIGGSGGLAVGWGRPEMGPGEPSPQQCDFCKNHPIFLLQGPTPLVPALGL